MQGILKLTRHKHQMAQTIWRRRQADLAAAKHEWQLILQDFQESRMATCVWQGMSTLR